MSTRYFKSLAVLATSALCLVAVLASCSNSSSSGPETSTSAGSSGTIKVGLLLPESLTPRYEAFDHPIFVSNLKKLCPKCEVVYANAGGDQATQQNQADSMFAQGVKLLVISPVNGVAAKTIVLNAHSHGIKVLGYGREVGGPVDYQVGDDLMAIGLAQGTALWNALTATGRDPKRGQIVVLNGDAATFETRDMTAGARSFLTGKVNIGRQYNVPNWDPATAQTDMDQAITALGKSNIIGVLAMTDGMAGGAITALQKAGVNPMIPVTGGDAELAAVQRMLIGTQAASEFHSPIHLAETAAITAAQIAQGQTVQTKGTLTSLTGNKIPFTPTPPPRIITRSTIKADLIDTGVYKVSRVCTAAYAAQCSALGIK